MFRVIPKNSVHNCGPTVYSMESNPGSTESLVWSYVLLAKMRCYRAAVSSIDMGNEGSLPNRIDNLSLAGSVA